jgi:hypothetical protein
LCELSEEFAGDLDGLALVLRVAEGELMPELGELGELPAFKRAIERVVVWLKGRRRGYFLSGIRRLRAL